MDCKLLISDLASAGVTQIEIGKSIGLSQPAVSDLARGRTLRIEWQAGEKLIALHHHWCRSEASAPTPAAAEESSPSPPAPEPIHECASGDPRCHPDRRRPEKRQRVERRKAGA